MSLSSRVYVWSICLTVLGSSCGEAPPSADEESVLLGLEIEPGARSFRSINYPDRYIRHRNFLGEISPILTTLDRKDAAFKFITGAADPRGVSIVSLNYPDRILRHQNFQMKLHQYDGTELFRRDSTFRVVPGIAGRGGVSFQSVNFPNRYIRHRGFTLYLEVADTALARADASFMIVPPTWQQ